MQEIKCPKCGEVFQVDQAGYAAIVKQVRDTEFNKELSERENLLKERQQNAVKLAQAETAEKLNEKLNEKDKEIAELKAKLLASETEKKLAG